MANIKLIQQTWELPFSSPYSPQQALQALDNLPGLTVHSVWGFKVAIFKSLLFCCLCIATRLCCFLQHVSVMVQSINYLVMIWCLKGVYGEIATVLPHGSTAPSPVRFPTAPPVAASCPPTLTLDTGLCNTHNTPRTCFFNRMVQSTRRGVGCASGSVVREQERCPMGPRGRREPWWPQWKRAG